MCPKLKQGICEIAGIEPEHIECAEKRICLINKGEGCKLYIADLLISSRPNFNNQFHRREVA